MHHSHDATPPPSHYDRCLAAGAATGSGGLAVFIITQLVPAFRVSAEARFAIILWCGTISGPGALCSLLRPHVAHLGYAMRLGWTQLPEAPDIEPRRSVATRRRMWGIYGTLGCCLWTLAAAIDLGAFTGKLNLHHGNLDVTTMLLCQIGAVCVVVRIVGPALAAVDDVYCAARAHAHNDAGAVIQLHHPAG